MVIFIHGADTYRSRKKLAELRAKFLKEVDPQGYNLNMFVGADAQPSKVMDAISSTPFLAKKRMVIVEDLSKMKCADDEVEALISVFEQNLEGETIVVVWEGGLTKTELKKKLYKTLLKSKYVMVYEVWNQQQVAGWMAEQMKGAGIGIDAHGLGYLSSAVGDNLWQASLETQKLIHYAKAKKKTGLAKADIELLVRGGVEDNIFALVDAVAQRNVQAAMKRLHDQIAAGSHELEILSMLTRQYRILQQVKDAAQKGGAPDTVAKSLGLHPFVVKKTLPQANRATEAQIFAAYHHLTECDVAIKSSGMDATVLLSLALAKTVI